MKIRQSDYRIYSARFNYISEVPSRYAMAHHVVGSRLPGAARLLIVYILLTFCANAINSRSTASSRVHPNNRNGIPYQAPGRERTQRNPLDDLARVLGIRRNPFNLGHHSPPEYLRHLYHSTTGADGVARSPSPHHADTIYGYLNTANPGSSDQRNYLYNVSRLETGTQLLNADFHVHRMRRRRSIRVKRVAARRRSVFLTLKLYKVVDSTRKFTPYGNKLIDVKRILPNYHGWIVFNAQQAVKEWIHQDRINNHGFLITAQTSNGQFIDVNTLSFAQRFRHHDKLQPLLAVYTNHTKKNTPDNAMPYDTNLTEAFSSQDPSRYRKVYEMNFYVPPPRIRERRSVEAVSSPASSGSRSNAYISNRRGIRRGGGYSRRQSRVERHSRDGGSQYGQYNPQMTDRQQHCSKRDMYVDFRKIGWDQWIISPQGFNAQICKGECPYPLGQTYEPTNHAVVQSIVHAMKVVSNVQRPCCAPHKLNPISLLYYDEKYRVILKQYDGMVVRSCGCH